MEDYKIALKKWGFKKLLEGYAYVKPRTFMDVKDIETNWDDGYYYSSYTYDTGSSSIVVRYVVDGKAYCDTIFSTTFDPFSFQDFLGEILAIEITNEDRFLAENGQIDAN